MRFTVLIYGNPDVAAMFEAMADQEKAAAYQVYWDVVDELEASGELVDSKAVDGAGQLHVTVGSDGTTTTAEVEGDVVTGYYLIDVADQARAVEIAARFPESRAPGGIRVARNFTQEDFDALGM